MSSKNNPQKLEALTTELPAVTNEIKMNIDVIDGCLNAIIKLYDKVDSIVSENQLVNARNVATYTDNVTQTYDALLDDTSLDTYRSKLLNCEQALTELVDYYKNHYLKTIERMDR